MVVILEIIKPLTAILYRICCYMKKCFLFMSFNHLSKMNFQIKRASVGPVFEVCIENSEPFLFFKYYNKDWTADY